MHASNQHCSGCLVPGPSDFDKLDMVRLEYIQSYLEISSAEWEPATTDGISQPHVGMVLPARGTQQTLAPEVPTEQLDDAQHVMDDMDEENLNSIPAVDGLMNAAVRVLNDALDSGRISKTSYLCYVGIFLVQCLSLCTSACAPWLV